MKLAGRQGTKQESATANVSVTGMGSSGRWSSAALQVAVLLLFCLLAVLLFWSAWQQPERRFIGVGGDPLQTVSFMSFVAFAAVHHQFLLFSPDFQAPLGVNLMWNTPVLALALLLAPVTLSVSGILAYNLAATLALALSGFVAYVMVRRITKHTLPALLAGLLYAISPYMIGQEIGHLNLVVLLYPPALGFFLYAFIVEQSWGWGRAGIAIGIATAIQLYVGEEVALSSCLAAAFVLFLAAMSRPDLVRDRVGPIVRALSLAAGIVVVLAGPAIAYQFFGRGAMHGILQVPPGQQSVLALLFPTANQWVAPHMVSSLPGVATLNLAEANVYAGIPLLLLLCFALLRYWSHLLLRIVVIAAAALYALSLGWWWQSFSVFPVIPDLLPNRIAAHADLLAVIAVALLLTCIRTRWERVVAGGLVLLTVLTWLPSLPRPVTELGLPLRIPQRVIGAIPSGSVVAYAPYADPFQPVEMLYTAQSHFLFRMVGGYAYVPGTGPQSPQYQLAALTSARALEADGDSPASPATVQAVRHLLGKLRVDYVLATPGEFFASGFMVTPDPVVARGAAHFYDAVLGRPIVSSAGFVLWRVAPS